MIFPKDNVRFLLQGEAGLVVEFGQEIAPEILAEVQSLKRVLQSDPPQGMIEMTPTYRSLLLVYNPEMTNVARLKQEVIERWPQEFQPLEEGRIIVIPTCYDEEFGPDLVELSQIVNLSPEEVIAEHTSKDYLIYMLGFTPGFPYLGGLSPRIACPRLSSPRTIVPMGSVGIAEQQTGIYPLATPGGWRLIGRSPIRVFNLHSSEPFLFQAGDWLRFQSIDRQTYAEIAADVERGSWKPILV